MSGTGGRGDGGPASPSSHPGLLRGSARPAARQGLATASLQVSPCWRDVTFQPGTRSGCHPGWSPWVGTAGLRRARPPVSLPPPNGFSCPPSPRPAESPTARGCHCSSSAPAATGPFGDIDGSTPPNAPCPGARVSPRACPRGGMAPSVQPPPRWHAGPLWGQSGWASEPVSPPTVAPTSRSPAPGSRSPPRDTFPRVLLVVVTSWWCHPPSYRPPPHTPCLAAPRNVSRSAGP